MLSDEQIDEMLKKIWFIPVNDDEAMSWNEARAIVRSYLEVKPEPEISPRTKLLAMMAVQLVGTEIAVDDPKVRSFRGCDSAIRDAADMLAEIERKS